MANDPSDSLRRRELFAIQLRKETKAAILKYRRDRLDYNTKINASSKFLRFAETPLDITSVLKATNIVYAIRIDTRAGKFNGTTCLFVKEGSNIPKLLKLMRVDYTKEDGVYVRRPSPAVQDEAALSFLVMDPERPGTSIRR